MISIADPGMKETFALLFSQGNDKDAKGPLERAKAFLNCVFKCLFAVRHDVISELTELPVAKQMVDAIIPLVYLTRKIAYRGQCNWGDGRGNVETVLGLKTQILAPEYQWLEFEWGYELNRLNGGLPVFVVNVINFDHPKRQDFSSWMAYGRRNPGNDSFDRVALFDFISFDLCAMVQKRKEGKFRFGMHKMDALEEWLRVLAVSRMCRESAPGRFDLDPSKFSDQHVKSALEVLSSVSHDDLKTYLQARDLGFEYVEGEIVEDLELKLEEARSAGNKRQVRAIEEMLRRYEDDPGGKHQPDRP